MKPDKIVSGGQTGADRGGLDAAIELKIPYGGYVPHRRKSEDGRVPFKYVGMTETRSENYLVRTKLNVQYSTATVIFTYGPLIGGSSKTKQFCLEDNAPYLHIDLQVRKGNIEKFKNWLESIDYDGDFVLNVAGNRESKAKGIQKETKELLVAAFKD